MNLCLPLHSTVRNQIQQCKYMVCPHFAASPSPHHQLPLVIVLIWLTTCLYHHTTLLLHPVSQGHPVNWTTVGPVLAIFTITAILLALTIVLVAALFKQRRTRHTGRYHTTPHHTTPQITPHHTTPHHITPHHTTPYHTTPHHTSHHTTPHHITPHHTTPHHTTPHHTTHHTTPHHITPHHTTPHHTTPHHTTLGM